ncbi:Septum site-determining protein MinC [Lutibaculum baratangense AMV1]|uniref:Probable septum site-determining protein MinC n=2 Tax=Lutibaculum TaxID=1358438 RepID=V4RGS7_9HYPH|nr:Septum site-determining protein MinC [Lutibaculum baratangense AMV1]
MKARSLLAFVLQPDGELTDWLVGLDHWLKGAPDFFAGRPVLLDLSNHTVDRETLLDLLSRLSQRGIRVMGIDGVESAWLPMGMPPIISQARQAGMREITAAAALTAEASAAGEEKPGDEAAPSTEDLASGGKTLIIDGPVRSGQSIVNPDGDVIVTGAVSSGAEVVAGGSVHVYGALRGRVCAGASDDENARIFAGRLEAEFVAIGAVFMTAETMDPLLRSKRVQARLDGVSIRFTTLN